MKAKRYRKGFLTFFAKIMLSWRKADKWFGIETRNQKGFHEHYAVGIYLFKYWLAVSYFKFNYESNSI